MITLHHTTSHYIILHHTTSHYITLHHTISHYITLHHTLISHYITLYHTTSHYITLHHTTSHYIALHHTISHYITLQQVAMKLADNMATFKYIDSVTSFPVDIKLRYKLNWDRTISHYTALYRTISHFVTAPEHQSSLVVDHYIALCNGS